MTNADDMLEAAAARAADLATPGMSARPRRRVVVLTCMDTRIDPLPMLGIERGDAHVLRNAGGLVTEDALRSIAISQDALGTEEVVVIMHEGCGMKGAPAELGGFDDLETALREGVERLRADEGIPHRDRVSGLVYDPEHGSLRRVD